MNTSTPTPDSLAILVGRGDAIVLMGPGIALLRRCVELQVMAFAVEKEALLRETGAGRLPDSELQAMLGTCDNIQDSIMEMANEELLSVLYSIFETHAKLAATAQEKPNAPTH